MSLSRLSYASGAGKGLMGMTLGDSLRLAAQKWSHNDALVVSHQNIRWSYQELLQRSEEVAKGLVALGLPKQARVGIYSPNRSEWVVAQFAAALADLILVNINPAYQEVELKHALDKVEVSAVILASGFKSSNYIELIKAIVPEVGSTNSTLISSKSSPYLKHCILLGDEKHKGFMNFDDLYKISDSGQTEYNIRTKNVDFESTTNIQFTSGTTGAPKAAALNHLSLLNNGYYCGQTMKYTEEDRVGIPVPLYHCFGMVIGNLACVTHGSTMVLPDLAFNPVATMDAVEKEGLTSLYGVPTMFIACLREQENKPRRVSTLRTGVVAGSLCPPDLMRKIIDVLGIKHMTNCYGMTETSPVSFQLPMDASFDQRTRTVGQVHPHVEAKVVDVSSDKILPRGEMGELQTRGYVVMQGYWGDKPATDKAITTSGWMRTGDLAVMDDDGFVSIVGRSKDTIIRGGENISPSEVEFFLSTHPEIEEVYVFGIYDETFGEKVATWIKMKDGCTPLTLETLKIFCHGKIAHFKIPVELRIVNSFPLTVTGKVMKFKMRDEYPKAPK